MTYGQDVIDYNLKLAPEQRESAEALCQSIERGLPKAEGKVWHGHPVWFLEGNPIVGYSLKKSGLEVLFWSGQSFKTAGLRAIGKFKAAALPVPSDSGQVAGILDPYLKEAELIQWDYANLPKKRELEELTKF